MKLTYAQSLKALLDSGVDEKVAIASLAIIGLAPATPSIASMVRAATPETYRRWFRSYLAEMTSGSETAYKNRIYFASVVRHFALKGRRYGQADYVKDTLLGVKPEDAAKKLGAWTVKPEPTDAEIDATWTYALQSGQALTIERIARKSTAFAPVDADKPVKVAHKVDKLIAHDPVIL